MDISASFHRLGLGYKKQVLPPFLPSEFSFVNPPYIQLFESFDRDLVRWHS
jgi:hypothetical protein